MVTKEEIARFDAHGDVFKRPSAAETSERVYTGERAKQYHGIVRKQKSCMILNSTISNCFTFYILYLFFLLLYYLIVTKLDSSVGNSKGYQSRGRGIEPRLGHSFFSMIDITHCD